MVKLSQKILYRCVDLQCQCNCLMPTPRPKHRVYVNGPLTDQGWPLDKPRSHYLRRVLRLGKGDAVVAFDGSGQEWVATLCNGETATLQPVETLPERRAESPLKITLVQALARGERMDLVLQKATELGVDAIAPVTSARTEVRLDARRAERRVNHWQAVLMHAAEQSGRTRLPLLHPLTSFVQWLALPVADDALRTIVTPAGDTRLEQLVQTSGPVIAAIGPEGGFTESEIRAAEKAGFVALTLGPRILRTETAGPALLAALQARWGDLG